MLLIAFLRARVKESIIVISASANTCEFLSILTNNMQLRSGFLTGKQDAEARAKSIERFEKGLVEILCATPTVLRNCDIKKQAKWAIHWDIPLEKESEIRLVDHLKAEKFLILLDPSHAEYMNLLGDVKVKCLPFDEKKIPKIEDSILSFCNKKSFKLHQTGQLGYRELIATYVHHEHADLFDARKLNLCDVCINYGIEHPPKLPLTK